MSSCRLFVKNFPKDATEKKIKEFFSAKGTVTDVSLKFTVEGKFRRFGFIGFASDAEAAEAQSYFDKTFMGASRLHVELSRDVSEKPRPWSKYSEGSTAYVKAHPEVAAAQRREIEQKRKEELLKKRLERKKRDFLKDVFGVLPDDEEFKEFLAVNQSEKLLWTNDEAAQPKETAAALQDEAALAEDSGVEIDPSPGKRLPKVIFPHVVVVRNLSFKWKRRDIKEFFKGLSVCSIRKCLKHGVKGVAYVAFKNAEDLAKALEKDKCFMERRRVHVIEHRERSPQTGEKCASRKFSDNEIAPDVIADTGRLFIRNLPYSTTEAELEELLKPFGPLAELHLSIDSITKQPKGFAFATFVFPEHAAKAYQALDYSTFHGRLMHVIPGLAKPQEDPLLSNPGCSSFKAEKAAKTKALASSVHSWNSLFLGPNAVADVMVGQYGVEKTKLLGTETGESVAVRMALGETQIVNETREFLEQRGVDLSVFKQSATQRSKTILLVKNLPAGTQEKTLWDLFGGKSPQTLRRVVLPPSGVTGLVEFCEPQEARSAFKRFAYTMFQDRPLYLEWAPVNVFSRDPSEQESTRPTDPGGTDEHDEPTKDQGENDPLDGPQQQDSSAGAMESDVMVEEGATLFVKNINFSTTSDGLKQHFASCRPVQAMVATKIDIRQPGKTLSMGYGFVQFSSASDAMAALKTLQHSKLDSHTLELKMSRREVQVAGVVPRKEQKLGKASTKILVRNVPFQATRKELQELFAVFGKLKTVRLPKKMFGGDTGSHRGFAFAEFMTKSDAKRAFDALCQSTHLYGRRLVLEWAAEEDGDTEALRRKTAEQFIEGTSSKRLKKADLMNTLEGNVSH
ncbi:putative RNA-binding protein 19-like [Tropilaelaps mercedesae]|uniref:Putative RNA-binding protein 19-like n=1 Tax=Tropilaelaps mercedesae TaxID=418985 RepID=A0A1V9XNB8_9ACAR|nr:putative RNA-binding protein 19-like [Tropilaelaps mercedesae]